MRSLAPLLVVLVAALARGQDAELRVAREVRLGDSFPAFATALALSPDGLRVACVVPDGVEVRDVATGERLHQVWTRVATATAFSPDGRLLAVARRRGLDAFDTSTWERVRGWEQEGADAVAFVSTDRLLWTNARRVAGGRATRGAPVERFDDERGFTGLVAARTGEHVAAVDSRGRAVVWEVATGRRLHALGDDVLAVTFSPDGARLVAVRHAGGTRPLAEPRWWWRGDASSTLAVWSVPDGEPLDLPAPLGRVHAYEVGFTGDRELVVLGSPTLGRAATVVYDLTSGAALRELRLRARGGEVLGVAAVGDGPWIVGRLPEVVRWPAEARGEVWAHLSPALESSFAFLPTGELAVADRVRVSVWDVERRAVRWSARVSDWSPSWDARTLLAASRDGRWLALHVEGGRFVQLFEVGTDRDVLLEVDGRGAVRGLCAGTTPDGFVLARDERLLEVGPERPRIRWHLLPVSPRGHGRLAAARDVLVVAGSRSRLRSFVDPELDLDLGVERATSAAITSDARLVALGTAEGQVVVVDAATGERVWRADVHASAVTGVAFTGDGGLVLSTAHGDASLVGRDARTGAPVGRIGVGGGRLVVAPTGRRLALVGGHQVRVVDLAP